MKIHLDRVRREPFVWDETVEVDAAELERDELTALGPIHWRGRVSFADPGFYLKARLDYEQTLACGRCLKPIVEPVASEVELLLEIAEPTPAAEEIELAEEDLGVVFLDDELFDTRPLLVEQLQLNLPMKPMCPAGCRGLCPRCGADLDHLGQGECSCGGEAPDPRWEALAALRERLPGGEN